MNARIAVPEDVRAAADELARVSRELYLRGWMPGTSGNLSVRLPAAADPGLALITASGRDKGELTAADAVPIDAVTGTVRPGDGRRASAETPIHAAVYRATGARAVIHVHAPWSTVIACRVGARPDELPAGVHLDRFELLKGLGLADPSTTRLPVLRNWPDVARIADEAAAYLAATPHAPPGLLIADHGVTVWGADLGQARNRLECIEAICRLIALGGSALTATPLNPTATGKAAP